MSRYIDEMAYHAKDRDRMFAAIVEYTAMDAGTKRAEAWLREVGLQGRVHIGVIGVVDDYRQRLDAWAKVMVPGTGMFEHRELYITFPSDHFKAKVLLVTGGGDAQS